MATIQKRGESYKITVSCGYDITGKQIRKTTTWTPSPGMTKRQTEKELERQKVLFEEQCRTGQFLDGNITLAEFSERWFKDYAEKNLKEKSLTGYKDIMPRILQALGHIRLAKLQPHHLMEFYNNLGEVGVRLDIKCKPTDKFKEILKSKGTTQSELAKKAEVSLQCVRSCVAGKNVTKKTADKISAALNIKGLFDDINSDIPLSDNTIAKYHRLISSMLTAAVHWQVIPYNPCSRVKPPRIEYKEAPVLDDRQVHQLIKCLDTEPLKYKTAIMLVLYSGMRRGELCGLNWSDIDFDNGNIHITKELLYTPNKGVYEDTPKTKLSRRVINIPPDMIKLLKRYRGEQNMYRLSIGDQWHDTDKVFTSWNGNPMHPDSLSAWYKKFIVKHNLPDSHIHTLRHSSATLLIANGVDVATVSGRLGHANKSTTLNIYTHAIESADEIAAQKLQNILSINSKAN